MEQSEDVILSASEIDGHDNDTAAEKKPFSKRQLKLQKRHEERLKRKAERRYELRMYAVPQHDCGIESGIKKF